MEQNVKDYVTQKVKEMMGVDYCCQEAKEAAQEWLDALGTDQEMEQTKNLIEELEADIMPVDEVIAFAGSEAGVKAFGEETAGKVEAHAREIKEAGAKYCDCAACAAAGAILEKKDQLL